MMATATSSSTSSSLSSSPHPAADAPDDDFLKSIAALRELLSVNYETLEENKNCDRLPPTPIANNKSYSGYSPVGSVRAPPKELDADESKELQTLRQKLENARNDLDQERLERKRLQASNATLTSENQSMKQKVESLSSLQSLAEELEIARARWKEEKDKAQRDQQKLKYAVEQVATERTQALQKVDACQIRILSLQQQVRELQTQRESHRKHWDSERTTYQDTIRSWEAAHATLQHRMEEQAKINDEVKDKLEVMQREYVQMQASNAECQQKTRQCQDELAKAREELTAAQSQTNGWKRTLDQTDRVLQECNQEIVDLQQKLEQERNDHDFTKQKLQQYSLSSESKRRQEQNHQEQYVQQLEQKITDLNQEVKDRVQKKLFDQKQYSDLRSQVQAKEELVQAKEKEIQQLKQKQEALSVQDTSNRARIEALRKSLTGLKASAATPDSATLKLRDELNQTKATLQATQIEMQQALVQLSSIVSPSSEGDDSFAKRSLGELIKQLVAENEQLKQESGVSGGHMSSTRSLPPRRQKSPRKLAQVAQEASKALEKKPRKTRL